MKLLEILNKIFTPLRIGSFFDVSVYLHWSWWMLFLTIFVISPLFSLTLIGFLLIILAHEFGNCYGASRIGKKPYSLFVYMIGGNCRGISYKFKEELIIAIFGQFATLLLMPILVLFWFLTQDPIAKDLASRLCFANISVFLVNFLPAFPLDGGRILRSWLVDHGVSESISKVVLFSGVVSVLFGIWGVSASNFGIVVLALLLYHAAYQERNSINENS